MASRLPSLLHPPVGFAHRGARAQARENTIEAFRLALDLGATGLESDVWLSADGQPVLDHDGTVRSGLRRRPFSAVDRRVLPGHIPTLPELYGACGTAYELSLDIKDPAAVDVVLAAARAAGAGVEARLWLCHPDADTVASWSELTREATLVNSTRLRHITEGPERRAARLVAAGVDAVNLHHSDWSGGLCTLFHRFELRTLGWDAQQDRVLDGLLDIGIDGVYSDHVDRMTAALARLEEGR